jgi:hypothetical protein
MRFKRGQTVAVSYCVPLRDGLKELYGRGIIKKVYHERRVVVVGLWNGNRGEEDLEMPYEKCHLVKKEKRKKRNYRKLYVI